MSELRLHVCFNCILTTHISTHILSVSRSRKFILHTRPPRVLPPVAQVAISPLAGPAPVPHMCSPGHTSLRTNVAPYLARLTSGV